MKWVQIDDKLNVIYKSPDAKLGDLITVFRVIDGEIREYVTARLCIFGSSKGVIVDVPVGGGL